MCDVLLMAAAVADFRPAKPEGSKIKKAGRDGLELALEPTEDVLGGLAEHRREGQTLIGFAAEHGPEAVERARGKLRRKGLDAIVFNDISDRAIGFDSAQNEVTIITAAGDERIARAAKHLIAQGVLDAIERLRGIGAADPAPRGGGGILA